MKPQDLGGVIVEKFDDGGDGDGIDWPLTSLWKDAPVEMLDEACRLFAPEHIDASRRVLRLALHTFLVRTKHHLILIDTCLGNDKERPARTYMHHRATNYLDQLKALGVAPEQIDFVFCTHLHADHVGWNTMLKDGRWVPTFPKARYVMLKREYEHWKTLSAKAKPETFLQGSFADSVLPVVEAGNAMIVDEADYVCDEVKLEHCPGHSPGNAVVNVIGRTGSAVCSGDVIHSPAQFHFLEQLTGCDDPLLSRASRKKLIERLAGTPTLLLPAHFRDPTAGRVLRKGGGYEFRFID